MTTTPGELTERQVEILEAICRLYRGNSVPPTLRDLMAALNIASPNGIRSQLLLMRKKGWLANQKKLSRGIRLLAVPGGWKLLPNGSVMRADEAREWILSECEQMELEQEVILKELGHD